MAISRRLLDQGDHLIHHTDCGMQTSRRRVQDEPSQTNRHQTRVGREAFPMSKKKGVSSLRRIEDGPVRQQNESCGVIFDVATACSTRYTL